MQLDLFKNIEGFEPNTIEECVWKIASHEQRKVELARHEVLEGTRSYEKMTYSQNKSP